MGLKIPFPAVFAGPDDDDLDGITPRPCTEASAAIVMRAWVSASGDPRVPSRKGRVSFGISVVMMALHRP
jgi:hypothetical protein